MSLSPPPEVRDFRDALHSKSEGAPGDRSYALYDELDRDDILRFAYDRCQADGGALGAGGRDFADSEARGPEAWLSALTNELGQETYRPRPVRRVTIPKGGQPGRFRPLGLPCIKDRAVQMAAVLVPGGRSSMRTSSPSGPRIAPSTAPGTPSGGSRRRRERAIPMESTPIGRATSTVSLRPTSRSRRPGASAPVGCSGC